MESVIFTLMTLWMAALCQAATPDDPTVTLVITPGMTPNTFSTLRRTLDRGRHTVQLAHVPCPSSGRDDTMAFLQTVNAENTVVVAHGIGALWAVEAGLDPTGWVWIAPLVDIWPTNDALTADMASRRAATLSETYSGCSSSALTDDFQSLAEQGASPDLRQALSAPVVALVSAGDDVATVEASIPVLLTTPLIAIRRIGVGGWGHQDLDHTDFITTRRGRRQVRRALRLLGRHQ